MIEWSFARSEEDAEDLRNFICTDPAPETFGPDGDIWELKDAWEWEAQAGIQDAPCPTPRGEYVLLGRDAHGLAAVCHWFEIAGPMRVKLLCAGVALRLRRSGQRVGDLLIEEVIQTVADNADRRRISTVTVYGLVHQRNGNSQALLHRHGFFYALDSGAYQEWWLRIDLPTET